MKMYLTRTHTGSVLLWLRRQKENGTDVPISLNTAVRYKCNFSTYQVKAKPDVKDFHIECSVALVGLSNADDSRVVFADYGAFRAVNSHGYATKYIFVIRMLHVLHRVGAYQRKTILTYRQSQGRLR